MAARMVRRVNVPASAGLRMLAPVCAVQDGAVKGAKI
jgi:hypothetical protein